MAEAGNQVTPEQAAAEREAGFLRAAERRSNRLGRELTQKMSSGVNVGGPLLSHKPTMIDKDLWEVENSAKAQRILSHLHDEEPYFVFRAQDILSSFALETYLTLLEKFNPDSPQVESCVHMLADFRKWQQQNPSLVKIPD